MPLGNNVERWDEEEQDDEGLDSGKWKSSQYKNTLDESEDLDEIEDDDLEPDFGTTVNRKRLRG